MTPALAEIRELAAQGDPQAANYLGWLHYWGAGEAPGIEKNERFAFDHCRQAAEHGLVNALLNVGFCYENGIGTPKSYELAVKVYWQAYLRGVPKAGEWVRRILPHIKI